MVEKTTVIKGDVSLTKGGAIETIREFPVCFDTFPGQEDISRLPVFPGQSPRAALTAYEACSIITV